ncbi:alpha/beta fold hydrolase [Allokutzneria albata]|uniref:Pimeloyl-ACP methyl ester carboxylesterase n=1 Tax=Allokutzneria albata TaxID=211114 RepID=A0A1G9XR30_ALLAB|nr:alpha/beta fold hydrolase [Allokutzneria albata]SDM98645.1 Pimeloyl-ACP methyl ester carboxylesterase [Allokutzneria albata]
MSTDDTEIRPAVVLLHAFPLDSRMWDAVRAPLEARFTVITPDQRGLGARPLGTAPVPSLDVVAADVLAQIEALGLERVVLGGISMGGYVAMALLRQAPELVEKLVLVDTKAVADNHQQRAGRLAMAERVEAEGTGWLADAVLDGLLGASTHAKRPDAVRATRSLIDAQSAEGVAWAQRAMAARPDSTDVLRDLDVPTLIVVGEQDKLTPPTAAQEMFDLLPDAELVLVPGCGHLPPIERPAEFAGVLLDWLT